MDDSDIRKVLLAAAQGPYNSAVPDLIPGWDYQKLSRVIGYSYDKGLVNGCEVTNQQSPHREFILFRITADGEDFLKTTSASSRAKKWVWAVAGVISGIVAAGAAVTTIASQGKGRAILERLIHLFR